MNDSKQESRTAEFGAAAGPSENSLDLDLPKDPAFSAAPPRGTWDDGWRLSEMAFEAVRDRPEVFVEREGKAKAGGLPNR